MGGPCYGLFDLGGKIAEGKESSGKKSGHPRLQGQGLHGGKGGSHRAPRCKLPSENLRSLFYRYFVSWLLRAELPIRQIAVKNNNLFLSSLKIKTSFKFPRWTVIIFFSIGADFACVAYCVGSLVKIFYSANTHFIF